METTPTTPNKETPANAPASLPPAKKFARATPPPEKRKPGRPPKPSSLRGENGTEQVTARRSAATAADSAPAYTARPDPAPISAPAAVRGLLHALTPLAGMATAMATKIELMRAMEIWRFSESELRTMETPGGAFLEKYAPSIDSFGVEIEFAGAVFQVVFPKILAIVAAKKLIEAATPARIPAKQPEQPKPAPTPIRAPAPAPAPEPAAAPPEEFEIEGQLPSPFATELNAGMPRAAAAGDVL